MTIEGLGFRGLGLIRIEGVSGLGLFRKTTWDGVYAGVPCVFGKMKQLPASPKL